MPRHAPRKSVNSARGRPPNYETSWQRPRTAKTRVTIAPEVGPRWMCGGPAFFVAAGPSRKGPMSVPIDLVALTLLPVWRWRVITEQLRAGERPRHSRDRVRSTNVRAPDPAAVRSRSMPTSFEPSLAGTRARRALRPRSAGVGRRQIPGDACAIIDRRPCCGSAATERSMDCALRSSDRAPARHARSLRRAPGG